MYWVYGLLWFTGILSMIKSGSGNVEFCMKENHDNKNAEGESGNQTQLLFYCQQYVAMQGALVGFCYI